MPIAAAPKYLGSDFENTPPGMRFGIFLSIWTERTDQENEVKRRASTRSREGQEIDDLLKHKGMDVTIRELQRRPRNPLPLLWEKNDSAAKDAWENITKLTESDKAQIRNLVSRQMALADACGKTSMFIMDATSIAPFSTGLGNEHPLENGFAFLNPYGLPYLPGSGVKGVVRQAARELASGEWGDGQGWDSEKRHFLEIEKNKLTLSMLDVLFGYETGAGDKEHVRGALSFWDVIPQIRGDHLAVDIMTPHQSHYYQNQDPEKAAAGSNTPHESGQPNPISFLTVPPKSGFVFHVQCDRARLKRLAPELLKNDRWKTLLEAAFTHAFAWLGFGAKTAVGYGAMESSAQRQQKQESETAQARQRQQENAETWEGAKIKFTARNGSLNVEKSGKTAYAHAPEGEKLLSTLPKDIQQKIRGGQFVKVIARVSGNNIISIGSST
jgi:CRISPR-associated protein Cmr6